MFTVRPAVPADIAELVGLLESFMADAFDVKWHGTADALARDAFDARFNVSVAIGRDTRLVGFAAWEPSYDLHHCVSGGHLIDMYVRPSHRGRGVALGLVADVAARIRAQGGQYLRGQAIPRRSVERMYERMAVLFPGAEANVGGRAFRALAELAGVPAREAARRLPPKEWNYEG